jgi:hypothetical protein
MKNEIKKKKLRLTGLYMQNVLRRFGLRKTAVGLRPLCGFLRHIFLRP